jgi:hypothetical protein
MKPVSFNPTNKTPRSPRTPTPPPLLLFDTFASILCKVR